MENIITKSIRMRQCLQAALEEMGIYHFDSWAANFGEGQRENLCINAFL